MDIGLIVVYLVLGIAWSHLGILYFRRRQLIKKQKRRNDIEQELIGALKSGKISESDLVNYQVWADRPR